MVKKNVFIKFYACDLHILYEYICRRINVAFRQITASLHSTIGIVCIFPLQSIISLLMITIKLISVFQNTTTICRR